MKEPLVTVVLPIYNVEEFLVRCIESVLNQSYSNLELLLIDDGSPDACPAICDAYAAKDARVRVIHKENEGLGMARNTGIDHATGDYICFFDSDDYVEPNTVEASVSAILQSGAEMVIFGHDNITTDGRIVSSLPTTAPKKLFEGEEICQRLLPMSLAPDPETGEEWNVPLSACNKLYDMRVIRESGWRFVSEKELLSEDYYSLISLYKHLQSVYVLSDVLYHYTVNRKSLSRAYREDHFERLGLFYTAMQTLFQTLDLQTDLVRPLNHLVFGMLISLMKNCLCSSLHKREKLQKIKAAVNAAFVQKLAKEMYFPAAGMQRKLFGWAVKHRLVLLCYTFVWLKQRTDA